MRIEGMQLDGPKCMALPLDKIWHKRFTSSHIWPIRDCLCTSTHFVSEAHGFTGMRVNRESRNRNGRCFVRPGDRVCTFERQDVVGTVREIDDDPFEQVVAVEWDDGRFEEFARWNVKEVES